MVTTVSIRNGRSNAGVRERIGPHIPVFLLVLFTAVGVLALLSDRFRPGADWLVTLWSGLLGGVFALALGWLAVGRSRGRMAAISVLYGDVVIATIAITAAEPAMGFLASTILVVTGAYAMVLPQPRVLGVHVAVVLVVTVWLVIDAWRSGPVTALTCGAIAIAVNLGLVAAFRTASQETRSRLLVQSELAIRDPLTGLLNRRGFERRFADLLRHAGGLTIAVVQADIDNFKAVNDLYGHEYGDVVLTAVAQRLHAVVRDDECLARTGGDEFMVAAAIEHRFIPSFAERLRSAIDQAADPVSITISVGVAVLPPMSRYSREHIQAVQRAADQAMYDAKRSGGNRIAVR